VICYACAVATRKNGVQRRDDLLDAALECFKQRSVTEVGIEDIRKAAGASASSVYHQFDGLNGLIAALLIRTFERFYGEQERAVRACTTAKDAIHALVRAQLDWVHGHRHEARFLFQALALELAGNERKAIERAKQAVRKEYQAHLAKLARADGLPEWPPGYLDLIVTAQAMACCRRYCAGHTVDWEWMHATLPSLAWRCVEPREA
jgi:AcrR family transcriptional regulator